MRHIVNLPIAADKIVVIAGLRSNHNAVAADGCAAGEEIGVVSANPAILDLASG